MKKRSLSVLFVLIIVICMLMQPVNAQDIAQEASKEAATDAQAGSDVDYLESIIEMIKEQYQGEVTEKELIEGALKGIFDTLDDYSTYFTLEETEEYLSDVDGSFDGIGITMELSGDDIVVVGVFKDTPADRAGLKPFDIISTIDDVSATGMSLEQAASIIRGEAGTSVRLGIRREGSPIRYFDIVRERIVINPVSYDIRSGGIGYIKLESFNDMAVTNFGKALANMDANKVTKIILDLRGNPGGTVISAVEIARKLIPEGLITKLDFKSEESTDESYYSYLKTPKYKLAVIVDKTSASASEILAGAIQDSKAGVLVGTNTFGKAQVQGLIPMLSPEAFEKYKMAAGADVVNAYDLIYKYGIIPYDEDIIGYSKMTIGVYTTPSGKVIDKEGLNPDIYIENPGPLSEADKSKLQRISETRNYIMGARGADILKAETILKHLGYYVEKPDDLIDIVSYRALRFFQKDNGISPDGVLNIETQKALNSKIEEIVNGIDLQYLKAWQHFMQ
ncbi:MAG: S41 family peptidase [Eubacteriales bacterium]|nr:S41 family peptidase [Eubacteriales bacterium]